MNNNFKECLLCEAKPGTPLLCESCWHNRSVISRLEKRLEAVTEAKAKQTKANHTILCQSQKREQELLQKLKTLLEQETQTQK